MGYSDGWNEWAVLPTGTWINPANPETNEFYSPGQTAYVMFKVDDDRTRPTRVLTGYGDNGWKVGDLRRLNHDQTGRYLGTYRVVGIHEFLTGNMDGDVPNTPIKLAVFK